MNQWSKKIEEKCFGFCPWAAWMFRNRTGRNQLSWAETPTAAENRQVEVWESGEQRFLLTNLLFDLTLLSPGPPTRKVECNKQRAALCGRGILGNVGKLNRWNKICQYGTKSSSRTLRQQRRRHLLFSDAKLFPFQSSPVSAASCVIKGNKAITRRIVIILIIQGWR